MRTSHTVVLPTPTQLMQHLTVTSLSRRRRAGWSTSVLIAVWLCVVALGWYCVVRYEFSINEPPAHAAVASWPSDSPLEHVVGRSTIVMFVHPKCPCTRATLNELERLLTATAGRQTPFDLLVIVTVPQAADPSWWNTDTVQHAERIAGARLYIDRDGREACAIRRDNQRIRHVL